MELRLIGIFLFILIGANCTPEVDLSAGTSQKFHEKLSGPRYQVRLVEPPIVFEGASAMMGSDGNWPFIAVLTTNNTVYADLNAYHTINDGGAQPKMGLGPTFKFKALPEKNDLSPLRKCSVKVHAQENQLLEDRYYGVPAQARDYVPIDKDCIDCNLSVSEGLKCRVKCWNDEGGTFKTVWHSSDPIVEMSRLTYSGLYAVTKSGQLLFIERDKKDALLPKVLHENLTFLPNRQGRFFVNASSIYACMKTDHREIYCAGIKPGSHAYGLTNHNHPMLSKIEMTSFDVEEVAFGGRHFCLLSEDGDVWCKGENGCGQITGRHDGRQTIDKLERVDFLKNKAQQLFAHAGGTCALLIDGKVQCWGLGASVVRTRLLSDSVYNRSLSWLHGFRPWRICEGGAENGL